MAITTENFGNFGEMFGFSGWNLGLGSLGNFIIWFVLALLLGIAVAGAIIYYFYKSLYKHKIVVVGMVGNQAMEKWTDSAKSVPIGFAGDRLFYLRKQKRMVAPPTLPIAKNKWLYWEREDGELINITYENLDERQRAMNVKFVDTDMRMQRLGIEKNLQFRLQGQTFWEKYGQMIVHLVFYIFVMMIMIVMFVQWRKTGEVLSQAIGKADQLYTKLAEKSASPHIPENQNSGSGLVPALITVGLIQFKIWRLRK